MVNNLLLSLPTTTNTGSVDQPASPGDSDGPVASQSSSSPPTSSQSSSGANFFTTATSNSSPPTSSQSYTATNSSTTATTAQISAISELAERARLFPDPRYSGSFGASRSQDRPTPSPVKARALTSFYSASVAEARKISSKYNSH